MAALVMHTFRECLRRAFPYVCLLVVLGLLVASKLFLAFTFGAQAVETLNLAISAAFLVGFVQAAFQGTALVRGDLERGTLALLLTKPLGLASYLCGRFAGLFLVTATLCAAMAFASMLLLALEPTATLLLARVLLPILILDAAALAISAVAPRTAAPVALVALFLLGSLAGGSWAGVIAPDFGLFGFDANAQPPMGLLGAYAGVFSSIFLTAAYIFLATRPPLRGGS